MPEYGELKSYFSGDKSHYYYKKAVENCNAFKPHSEGCYPQELIECRRPNEPLEVKEYREKIWKPITKPSFGKIVSSLAKIRRSQDWSIKYPLNQDDFSKISEQENLEEYCENNFPDFTSVTNWVFSVLLKKYLTDPNGVILIQPKTTEVEENEYVKPFPVIFDCCDVVEFINGEYAILSNPLGCYYMHKGKTLKGKSYYIIDVVKIETWNQTDSKGTMTLVDEYEHGLDILPVFKLGGIICESEGGNYLYESRISGILPELDEALREYSDLQAAKVLHVYPERWEYTSNECTTCKGLGRRSNSAWHEGCDASIPAQIDCDTCRGAGYVAAGPYAKMLIKPAGMGTQQLPSPPAGYVEKDVEIVKLMQSSVREHIYEGLSAINFQFLDQAPLNQSGVAKEVDKDELNNTVHAIAEDIVSIMDNIYKIIAYYRYKTLYTFDEIDNMLPTISVPERFDLLSSTHLEQALDTSKKAGLNPVLLNAQEVEFANKRFNNDSSVRDRLQLILSLDPLPNHTEDNKMSMLSNSGITKETYIISSNIQEFVQRAIDEDKEFATNKTLKEQKALMLKYAQEIIAAVDSAKKIVSSIPDPAELGNSNISELDQIGKLPLAIQQLSLAATRASESGDQALAQRLNKKVDELLKSVGV